ncbi:Succinyl-CoA--D-citramalate CoA-transferase [Geodia barretti]|uniref:Succinyl-CoA--D-citramalate CoA-transferase n=1 Tax=Geodia barretti TaxID=519541 RepID=A0AA35XEE8_GEOBA|nr:Succinyl-CoA--D-citramalate CoA-transferase [Geodia barretti]
MNFARLGAEVIKVELPGKGDPGARQRAFHRTGRQAPAAADARRHIDALPEAQPRCEERYPEPQASAGTQDVPRPCEVVRCDAGEPRARLADAHGPGLQGCFRRQSRKSSTAPYQATGRPGEYADRPAHDPQIQGMSGLMEINGHPDGPPTRVGFYIGDLVTPLFACYAITAALREKERTGKGQYLDVSMMDTLTSIMLMDTLEDDVEMGLPLRMGNTTRGGPTGLYRTSDGELTITAASDDQWRRLANALDSPELAEDPRFAEFHSRTANVVEAREEIQKRVEKLTRAEALERFEAADVPCGAVRTHGKMDDPVPGIVAGFPVIFSGGELPEPYGAPTLGMHNEEIYGGVLNLSDDEIAGLKEEGVI